MNGAGAVSERVLRRLEWRLSWKVPNNRYENTQHFDDIEALKRARTAVNAMIRAGLATSLRTEQRYAPIEGTPWVRPAWIEPQR